MKTPLICSALIAGLVMFGGHSAFAQSRSTSTTKFTSEEVQKILDRSSAPVRQEVQRQEEPFSPLSRNYTLTLICKDKDGRAQSSQIMAAENFNRTVVLSGAEIGFYGVLSEEDAGKIKLRYTLRGLAGWRMNNSGQNGTIYLSPGKVQTIFEEDNCACALQLTPMPVNVENPTSKSRQPISQNYTILIACAANGKRQEYALMVTGEKFGALLRESDKSQTQLNFGGTLESLGADTFRLKYNLTHAFGGIAKSYFSSSSSTAVTERCDGGVYLNLNQELTVLETGMGTYSLRVIKAEQNTSATPGEKIGPSGKNYRLKMERTENGTTSISTVVIAGGKMDVRSSDGSDQSCPAFLSGSLQEYDGGGISIDYQLRMGMNKDKRNFGGESDSFSSNVYLQLGVPHTILKSPMRSCTLTVTPEDWPLGDLPTQGGEVSARVGDLRDSK
ncbi:MAG: hypothetical protein LBV12_02210 [Puniceicoccales bacterium]|nr:hypothetical protein [Puniceicoccales bacterium]